ncbi:MAG: CoB--CoM heterodisulfide reductase iron-sulfur subunit B family protein [Methanobacteriota archaeon]
MKLGYYPGCSLESTAKEYDMSMREVFKALDVELVELEDWNCCGATAAHSVDYLLSLALPARNLAIAERDDLDIVVPCPECYQKEWSAGEALGADSELLEKVNTLLGNGPQYKGGVEVKHPLDVILNNIGIEKLSQKVVKPLKLKVVPYYGCVIVKPPRKKKFDSAENPVSMDRILAAIGIEVLPYDLKTRCCGGPVMLASEEIMLKLSYELLNKAKTAGAQCVVTACPLCHMALDAKQINIEKAYNEKINVPVLYFTQLMGLALGIAPKKLGLDKNIVSTEKLLKYL